MHKSSMRFLWGDFRPIAVLPVLFKLYSRVLYMLGETMSRPLQAPQFAFRKYHQAQEVVFILRQLIEKAVEWRAPHLFVMDGDIKKAYDYVSHKAFAEAARENGISEILILAWLREWRSMKSIFKLDADTKSEEIERSRSLPQGDPAAPCLFNITLDRLASRFILLCRRKKWGKKLEDGTWVDIILFADNYWLVAVDHKMLENMTKAWLSLLAEYGWETPTEELTWCTTQDDGGTANIVINDKRTLRTKAAVGFKVLGTYVTFDNNYEVEIENRLTKADKAFWANWSLLGCVSVPLPKRLSVFKATVNASMLWCAGTWYLTRNKTKK